LHEEDLMICGGDDSPLCIAGVFGGLTSGVTEKTVNIFLESAHFNPRSIRPNMVVFALKRAALLLQELAGAEVASEIRDFYPNPIEPVQVSLKYEYINRLIGEELSPGYLRRILEGSAYQ